MRWNRRQRRLGGAARPGGKVVVACAVFVLSLALSSLAADPVQMPAKAVDRRVTLNQGVAIDPEQAPASHPLLEGDQRPSHETDGRIVRGEGAGNRSRAAGVLRRGQRTGVSRPGDRLSGSAAVPWYRTGLGALAVVLALVGVTTWAVRRWLPAARTVDHGVLRVVGRVTLSPKQTLALVQVGRRFVLVGVSGDRQTWLCEVTDPDEVAELAARTGCSSRRGTEVFDDLLAREGAGYHGGTPGTGDQTQAGQPGRVRSRGPLNDLLRRLRTLQTS